MKFNGNDNFEDNELKQIKFSSEEDYFTKTNSSPTLNRASFSDFPQLDPSISSGSLKSSSKVEIYQKFCLLYTADEITPYQKLQFKNHEVLKQPMTEMSRKAAELNKDVVKSTKGRKRKQFSAYANIRELIEQEVVPQWTKYLKKKMLNNEDKETGITPRDDTIWKKIFRDLREFFRILFKARFHPLDYKSCEQADGCTKILLEEIGVVTSNIKPYELRKIFYFFHQTRLNSSDHYSSDYVEKEGEMFAMDIVEKYKDSLKALFMVDPISSKLFYFLYYNFDYIYYSYLKEKYKGLIDSVIMKTLECYEKIESKESYVSVIKSIF
eukprot:CAMPEP_0168332646 /NCGR_PEP_ID=MMETSP0213-20121227/9088_1 /TAXON_ID=151035 /ORGANISM="Euplotes harpa, Strain FSP1.4" /LENGTH=324 /DNA_ID=CAMNT_0008336723 /DNA_START=263 /DNA_END=1238 /DNA_ORIENTATION=-